MLFFPPFFRKKNVYAYAGMILIISYSIATMCVFLNVLILEVGVLLLFLLLRNISGRFLQFAHTRAIVGTAGLVQVLLEHLQVQVGTRFHLQFDGEVIDHILDD